MSFLSKAEFRFYGPSMESSCFSPSPPKPNSVFQ